MAVNGSIVSGVLLYLRTRPWWAKMLDVGLALMLISWGCVAYLLATNFDSVYELYRQIASAADEKVNLSTAVTLNVKIDEELTILREKTNGDRAYVAKFHNGKKDLQGIHFIYSTRINEVVGPGIASTINIRQNVLLSIINEWVMKMLDNKCVTLSNLSVSHPFYQYLREGGIKGTTFCPIMNNRGELTGVVGIEYVGAIPSDTASANAVTALRETAIRISGMFSIRDAR